MDCDPIQSVTSVLFLGSIMSDTQMDSQHSSVCDRAANTRDDLFPRFGFMPFSSGPVGNVPTRTPTCLTSLMDYGVHTSSTPQTKNKFMHTPPRVSLTIFDFPGHPVWLRGEDRRDTTMTIIGRLTDMSINSIGPFLCAETGSFFANVHGTVLESRISDLSSSMSCNAWLGCGLEAFLTVS